MTKLRRNPDFEAIYYFSINDYLKSAVVKSQYSLTIQLHPVKISVKSNKTRIDQIFFTSLHCPTQQRKRRSPIATEKLEQNTNLRFQGSIQGGGGGSPELPVKKLRRTHALQKNLFETLTSRRYIPLVLIITTHRQ